MWYLAIFLASASPFSIAIPTVYILLLWIAFPRSISLRSYAGAHTIGRPRTESNCAISPRYAAYISLSYCVLSVSSNWANVPSSCATWCAKCAARRRSSGAPSSCLRWTGTSVVSSSWRPAYASLSPCSAHLHSLSTCITNSFSSPSFYILYRGTDRVPRWRCRDVEWCPNICPCLHAN